MWSVKKETKVRQKEEDAAASVKRQTMVFSATLTIPSALRKLLNLKPSHRKPRQDEVGLERLMEQVPFSSKPKVRCF